MSQDGPKQTEYSMELKLAAVRRPGAHPCLAGFLARQVETLNSAISLAPATHWVAHPSRTLRRVGVGNTCATWFRYASGAGNEISI